MHCMSLPYPIQRIDCGTFSCIWMAVMKGFRMCGKKYLYYFPGFFGTTFLATFLASFLASFLALFSFLQAG